MNQHGQYTSPALFVELTVVGYKESNWQKYENPTKMWVNLCHVAVVGEMKTMYGASSFVVFSNDSTIARAFAETPNRIMELSYYAQGIG